MVEAILHGSERKLSPSVLLLGTVLIIGTLSLAARLIWEMTWLTWRDGPQMIGFSLAHGDGAFLLLFPPALLLWICVGAGSAASWKWKNQVVARQTWVFLICACLAIGTNFLPQSLWNNLFAGRLASSPHAADLLITLAGNGEEQPLRAMVRRGIAVNSTNYVGDTALHAAASTCRPSIMSFLIANGADVSATNLYGDSPLQKASERHCSSGVALLEQHKARQLKGTPEQRAQASSVIVRRQMDRLRARENSR